MNHIYEKLNTILEKFPQIRSDNKYYPDKYDMAQTLSEERLKEIQKEATDLFTPHQIKDNWNAFKLKSEVLFSIGLKELLEEEFGGKRLRSGFFWYPLGGFCGWHTNNNCEGERIYLAWSAEDNKSFFRYQDPDTKEIITDWDKKGWQYRKFNVSKNKPFWHCVGSQTNRISIGFREISVN